MLQFVEVEAWIYIETRLDAVLFTKEGWSPSVLLSQIIDGSISAKGIDNLQDEPE